MRIWDGGENRDEGIPATVGNVQAGLGWAGSVPLGEDGEEAKRNPWLLLSKPISLTLALCPTFLFLNSLLLASSCHLQLSALVTELFPPLRLLQTSPPRGKLFFHPAPAAAQIIAFQPIYGEFFYIQKLIQDSNSLGRFSVLREKLFKAFPHA